MQAETEGEYADFTYYTHPCVYSSFKIGGTWYPQSTVCASPYGGNYVRVTATTATCVYGEHWLRDAVNSSAHQTTYHCP